MRVVAFTTQTTLNELPQFGPVIEKLYAAIAAAQIPIVGANQWNYLHCDGTPDAPFTLEIVVPVAEGGSAPEGFELKTLPEFKCITHILHGPYSQLSEVYGTLMPRIAAQGHTYNGQSREVYLVCDFEDQSRCITEIQIGIL